MFGWKFARSVLGLKYLVHALWSAVLILLIAKVPYSGYATSAYPSAPGLSAVDDLSRQNPSPYPGANESGAFLSEISYPGPSVADNPITADSPMKFKIPTDHIVEVSSDGEIHEIDSKVYKTAKNVSVHMDNFIYVPATYPEGWVNRGIFPEPLRIIGPDDRVKITNTTNFPWSAMVRITKYFTEDKTGACSGWMLGPSTVVTAGHCVYDYYGSKQ